MSSEELGELLYIGRIVGERLRHGSLTIGVKCYRADAAQRDFFTWLASYLAGNKLTHRIDG